MGYSIRFWAEVTDIPNFQIRMTFAGRRSFGLDFDGILASFRFRVVSNSWTISQSIPAPRAKRLPDVVQNLGGAAGYYRSWHNSSSNYPYPVVVPRSLKKSSLPLLYYFSDKTSDRTGSLACCALASKSFSSLDRDFLCLFPGNTASFSR